MLATALAFHGLAMSGGVLDAVERMSPDVENIEDAFQWHRSGKISRPVFWTMTI
jgi:hypothetical protein